MEQKLTKSIGSEVEVCYKDNNFGTIWYKAIIKVTPLSKHRSKKRGLCVKLLKDDFVTPFSKLSNNVLVRPVPPVHVEACVVVKEGCVVDVSRGDEWWVGLVVKVVEEDKCLVFFDSPVDVVLFERKDLRPHLDWVDEIHWTVKDPNLETKDVPLTQASGNTMSGSLMNGNTPSRTKQSSLPVTTQGKTPLKHAETETQGKTPKRTLLRSGNDATRANENNEKNNRKRKLEENVSSAASVEEIDANDTATILPFEKKLLSIWQKVESREAFKTVPQSPHFSTLLETEEDSRETFAIGMMFTYCALIEQVKALQFSTPISTLKGLMKSFAVLEKNGFDVKEPQSQIHKVFSLKDMQAKKAEEAKRTEKELEEKILELKEKRHKELEDAKLQFQSIISTPK